MESEEKTTQQQPTKQAHNNNNQISLIHNIKGGTTPTARAGILRETI